MGPDGFPERAKRRAISWWHLLLCTPKHMLHPAPVLEDTCDWCWRRFLREAAR